MTVVPGDTLKVSVIVSMPGPEIVTLTEPTPEGTIVDLACDDDPSPGTVKLKERGAPPELVSWSAGPPHPASTIETATSTKARICVQAFKLARRLFFKSSFDMRDYPCGEPPQGN